MLSLLHIGDVAEWLNAAGCKPVSLQDAVVQIHPSPPKFIKGIQMVYWLLRIIAIAVTLKEDLEGSEYVISPYHYSGNTKPRQLASSYG